MDYGSHLRSVQVDLRVHLLNCGWYYNLSEYTALVIFCVISKKFHLRLICCYFSSCGSVQWLLRKQASWCIRMQPYHQHKCYPFLRTIDHVPGKWIGTSVARVTKSYVCLSMVIPTLEEQSNFYFHCIRPQSS